MNTVTDICKTADQSKRAAQAPLLVLYQARSAGTGRPAGSVAGRRLQLRDDHGGGHYIQFDRPDAVIHAVQLITDYWQADGASNASCCSPSPRRHSRSNTWRARVAYYRCSG